MLTLTDLHLKEIEMDRVSSMHSDQHKSQYYFLMHPCNEMCKVIFTSMANPHLQCDDYFHSNIIAHLYKNHSNIITHLYKNSKPHSRICTCKELYSKSYISIYKWHTHVIGCNQMCTTRYLCMHIKTFSPCNIINIRWEIGKSRDKVKRDINMAN